MGRGHLLSWVMPRSHVALACSFRVSPRRSYRPQLRRHLPLRCRPPPWSTLKDWSSIPHRLHVPCRQTSVVLAHRLRSPTVSTTITVRYPCPREASSRSVGVPKPLNPEDPNLKLAEDVKEENRVRAGNEENTKVTFRFAVSFIGLSCL